MVTILDPETGTESVVATTLERPPEQIGLEEQIRTLEGRVRFLLRKVELLEQIQESHSNSLETVANIIKENL